MAELNLAELAEITLRLERGEPRERVLAERGLSEEEWLDQQMVWLSRMAAQVERQRHALFQRYVEVRQTAASTEPSGPLGATSDARPETPARAPLLAGAPPAGTQTIAFSPVEPPPLYAARGKPAPKPPPLHVAPTSPVHEAFRPLSPPAVPLPAPAAVTPAHAPPPVASAPAHAPPPVAFAPAHAPPPVVSDAHFAPPAPVASAVASAYVAPPAPVRGPIAPVYDAAVRHADGHAASAPASSGTGSPQLALQQLALLVADLTVYPERSHATLEQSGLTPSAWQAEWNAWQHKFANDPAERGRYDPLLAYYIALIRPR